MMIVTGPAWRAAASRWRLRTAARGRSQG